MELLKAKSCFFPGDTTKFEINTRAYTFVHSFLDKFLDRPRAAMIKCLRSKTELRRKKMLE